MNYIDKTKRVQVLYFPRNGYIPDAEPELVAKDTTGLESVAFVVGSCEMRGHLLRLVIEIPDALHPGEWLLTLSFSAGGSPVALTGLLQVTEGKDPGVEYNREITYQQYGE